MTCVPNECQPSCKIHGQRSRYWDDDPHSIAEQRSITDGRIVPVGKSFVRKPPIYNLVRHKAFRDNAAEHFKGTAGQQRVPQSFLEQKLIPVPPLPEQRRIVAELEALQAEVDALNRLQDETADELDALLPAILDRAFRGEL